MAPVQGWHANSWSIPYFSIYAEHKKRHRFIEQSFRLCGRRRGWDVSREQHRNVYYLGWNRSPAQVGCMRQVLGPGALGRPTGIGWRGRWEGGSGWGTHVNPWLFHFNVWQNPLRYIYIYIKDYYKGQLNNQMERHTAPGLEGSPGQEFLSPESWSV